MLLLDLILCILLKEIFGNDLRESLQKMGLLCLHSAGSVSSLLGDNGSSLQYLAVSVVYILKMIGFYHERFPRQFWVVIDVSG